jgi:bifunctional non-homologous end joining protein LigD
MKDLPRFVNSSAAPASQAKPRKPAERYPHLVYVVQKREHPHPRYDLRLEVRGAFKSWVIPKGPSMNPREAHFAIETEQLDAKAQQGEVSGGAIIWDRGWYEPVGPGAGPSDRMVRGIRRGAMRFILHGKKLKGGFSLVKIREPDQWLLTKRDDMYADDAPSRGNSAARSSHGLEEDF